MKKETQAEKVEQFVDAVQISQQEKEALENAKLSDKVWSEHQEELKKAWEALDIRDKYIIYLVNHLQELSRQGVGSLSQQAKDYVAFQLSLVEENKN